jgi:FkbM family methyltransferase
VRALHARACRARETAPVIGEYPTVAPAPKDARARSKARQTTARIVHGALRRLGFDLIRVRNIDDFATRRGLALDLSDVVVDVGANVGQYGTLLRGAGFSGRIVSFEPLPSAFEHLRARAAADGRWTCFPIALGDHSAAAVLNVSGNRVSSSMLRVRHKESTDAPETAVVDRVEVQVGTLDSLRDELFSAGERLFVKLDVQGAEAQVLAGAWRTLDQVTAIECELTILPLYEDQPLISEMTRLLAERHFRLVAIEPEYRDLRTGELKQLNGLFVTPELRSRGLASAWEGSARTQPVSNSPTAY